MNILLTTLLNLAYIAALAYLGNLFVKWLSKRESKKLEKHAREYAAEQAKKVQRGLDAHTEELARGIRQLEFDAMQAVVADPSTIIIGQRSPGAIPLLVGTQEIMTEDGPAVVNVVRWERPN